MSNRRARRSVFRGWLKRNNIPDPKFKKVSEKLLFNELNQTVFIEELKQVLDKAKKDEGKV